MGSRNLIDIDSALASAAMASSRYPAASVTVEKVAPVFTEIPGLSLAFTCHRFQQGDGFYIATGYECPVSTPAHIVVKRMTSVDEAADWNGAWTVLVASATTEGIKFHDMIIEGQYATVVYEKTNGVIYAIESSDYGQTWGTEYKALDLSATFDRAYLVSLVALRTMYVYAFKNTASPESHMLYKAHGLGGSAVWSLTDSWNMGSHFVWKDQQYPSPVDQIIAREIGSGSTITMSARKGTTRATVDKYSWIFNIQHLDPRWSVATPSMGGVVTGLDYRYNILNASRKLNDYYFAYITERAVKRVDENGIAQYILEEYIARTIDFKSFHLIPFSTQRTWGYLEYLAGVAVDGNQVCIPIRGYADCGTILLATATSWFGEAPDELDITDRVVENVQISHSVNTAAKFGLTLSNRDGALDDHDIIKPGSVIRVSAGYNIDGTPSLQQRFTGKIVNIDHGAGADKITRYDVVDTMRSMTAIRQSRPHIIRGQNVFYSHDELDYFVVQSGLWAEESGWIEQSASEVEAIILAGYNPNDAHFVQAHFRAVDNIVGVNFGLVVHHNSMSNTVGASYIFRYNQEAQRFEVCHYDIVGGVIIILNSTAAIYNLAKDTDYYLLAVMRHGALDVYYSTDGITWGARLFETDLNWFGSPTDMFYEGYAGVYCHLPGNDAGTLRFKDIKIHSMYLPLSGSDGMKYIAELCGLDTDEQLEIDDDFDGTAFSSRWDTPGVDGTWTVSTSLAKGTKTGGSPALLACDVSGADIIVKASIQVLTDPTGLFIRGSDSLDACYAGLLSATTVQIKKKSGGVWTTLFEATLHAPDDTADLLFVGRGAFLSLFSNNELLAVAYDSDLTDGLIGLVSDTATNSEHDEFVVDGFYKQLDVIVIRPNDTAGAVAAQIVTAYEDGYFYANEEGALKWGLFDSLESDLDAREIETAMNYKKNTDKILTAVHIIGDNAYSEVRDTAWAAALGGHQ